MRLRRSSGFADNSGLVPMADMLSNTVGIMLFIMAFTVLQTGGILILKRLPIEQKTDSRPIYVVCFSQRLFLLNPDLSERLSDHLGEPTYDTAKDWVSKFNESKEEDEYFVVTGEGETRFNSVGLESSVALVLTALYRPKEEAGETIKDLGAGKSKIGSALAAETGNKKYVYFLVYPDCIDLFLKARDSVAHKFGLGTGWGPIAAGEPIKFNLSGNSGISPLEQ